MLGWIDNTLGVMYRVHFICLSLYVGLCACSQGAKASPASEELPPVAYSAEDGAAAQVVEFPPVEALGTPAQFFSKSLRASGPFAVPDGLRGRVDFWKDIFAKYTSNQVVVHHREFPQLVFGVIDLTAEAQSMGPGEFERHKDAVEERTVAAVRREVEHLARGEAASTDFQKKIVRIMEPVQGGGSKYRRLLDEDLIRTQSGIRDRYAEAIRRARRYLPMMEHIFVHEYGLPKELTRLPFVESSFDYTAYSSVGAAGIWQFMPRTARAHNMRVGRYVDERRDPLKATYAAAEYLRAAYRSLGEWPLAITSYNHGVGGVRSKVRKAGTDDIVAIVEHPTERFFGFASSNFYPEFLAAVEIYENHHVYFPEVKDESPLRLVSVPLMTSVSPQAVARQLDIPLEELRESNYALLDPVWRGAAKIPAGYTLQVPVHYQDRVPRLGALDSRSVRAQVVPVMYSPAAREGVHRVKRGETLGTIAKRYGVSTEDLMVRNDLSSSTLKAGQSLQIGGALARQQSPASREEVSAAREAVEVSAAASMVPEKKGVIVTSEKKAPARPELYTVRRGDTLSLISKKTGRTVKDLKHANHIKGNTVKVGQKIVLPHSPR